MRILKPALLLATAALFGCNAGTNLDGTCNEELINDYNSVVLSVHTLDRYSSLSDVQDALSLAQQLQAKYPNTVCYANVYSSSSLGGMSEQQINVSAQVSPIISTLSELVTTIQTLEGSTSSLPSGSLIGSSSGF